MTLFSMVIYLTKLNSQLPSLSPPITVKLEVSVVSETETVIKTLSFLSILFGSSL